LAAARQERRGVLEVVASDRAAERLRGRERAAVTRVDVRDLALGHDHERHLVHAVLPREEEEVDAAAQHGGLEARLARERDQPAADEKAAERPELLDDANAVVRHVADAEQPQQQQNAERNGREPDERGRGHDWSPWSTPCDGKPRADRTASASSLVFSEIEV